MVYFNWKNWIKISFYNDYSYVKKSTETKEIYQNVNISYNRVMALWTFCFSFSIFSISFPSLLTCHIENITYGIELGACFSREWLRCRKRKPTNILGSLDQMMQSKDCTKSWGATLPSSGCNSSSTDSEHGPVCVWWWWGGGSEVYLMSVSRTILRDLEVLAADQPMLPNFNIQKGREKG